MSALLTKHLPLLTTATTGVKKLRTLILDLAVEGRLLQGNLQQWRRLRLPEVATYRIGKTPPSKDPRHWDQTGIPWVSISDMKHFSELTETTKRVSTQFAGQTFKYPPIAAGSLLMSFKLTVGKICVLGVDAYHNEAIISLQAKDDVSPDYLMRVLPSIAKGGKQKNALMGATLNSESLAELVVPLPPYEEQVSIVAKIDELMALCDRLEAQQAGAESAHAQLVEALLGSLTQARDTGDFAASWQRLSKHFHALFTNEASIDALKQAILQLAVMGKLVKQDTCDDHPSQLLAQVESENSKLAAEGKKRKLAAPITTAEEPFPIPDNWVWIRLGRCLEMFNGRAFKSSEWKSAGLPIVRIQNLNREDAPYNYCDATGVDDRHLIDSGRLLISWSGTPGTSFGAFIWDRGPAALNQHIFSCSQIGAAFFDRFLTLAINARLEELIAKAHGGVGLQHVTKGTLEDLVLVLPPIEEQHRIIAKVDQLMAVCDLVKSRLTKASQLNEQLASAFVERAVA